MRHTPSGLLWPLPSCCLALIGLGLIGLISPIGLIGLISLISPIGAIGWAMPLSHPTDHTYISQLLSGLCLHRPAY